VKPERTLVIIKPDAVERGLVGEIIKHFENSGVHVRAIKIMTLDKEKAKDFYTEHEGKPFFEELVDYITCAPVVALLAEGLGCVEKVRKIIGDTDPLKAEQGSIRNLYAVSKEVNSVHASDSTYAASRELDCLFDNNKGVA
jgi:nucleoside-diphosphate kinase